MSGDADDNELAELIALTREHLRWELDLGSRGLPDLTEEARARPASDVPAPEVRPPNPAPAREAEPPRAEITGDDAAERRARLDVIATEVASCTTCRLHAGRTRTVFARGNPGASLVFVGEGPGFNEDQQGLPFVGPAGQLLDKMIGAMGFSEDEVYICNVVKCRPPENRTPSPDEVAACAPYLRAQLALVAPRVIVALGRCAAEAFGVVAQPWRGAWALHEGVPVMATYHPAYLLRSPEQKRPVWEDLRSVVARMGRTLPSPSGR